MICLALHSHLLQNYLTRATAMNMTNVLVTSIVGLTTVKTTQQEKLTAARRNPAFWETPGKPGLTGTAAGHRTFFFSRNLPRCGIFSLLDSFPLGSFYVSLTCTLAVKMRTRGVSSFSSSLMPHHHISCSKSLWHHQWNSGQRTQLMQNKCNKYNSMEHTHIPRCPC